MDLLDPRSNGYATAREGLRDVVRDIINLPVPRGVFSTEQRDDLRRLYGNLVVLASESFDQDDSRSFQRHAEAADTLEKLEELLQSFATDLKWRDLPEDPQIFGQPLRR